jgi:DNA-binding transcriptional LysR family regulator
MLRPEQLQIYTRVAELASFTQAADSLGLPKASVSQAVQQLEAELGTRLLHRTTRRVQTTQDGQVFYERCKDLLAQLDEAQSLFRKGGEALRGRLRVDMPSGIARQQVLPHLAEFLALHPELELELSSTDRRVDLVREGFDCVLRIGTLDDSALVARPLGHMAQINCASPAYLARHGTPQTLDDLTDPAAGHRLVHYLPTLGARPVGWEYVAHGGRVDGERHGGVFGRLRRGSGFDPGPGPGHAAADRAGPAGRGLAAMARARHAGVAGLRPPQTVAAPRPGVHELAGRAAGAQAGW